MQPVVHTSICHGQTHQVRVPQVIRERNQVGRKAMGLPIQTGDVGQGPLFLELSQRNNIAKREF